MMISPSIVIVRRPLRRSVAKRSRSLRGITRRFFSAEDTQVLIVEILIFVFLLASAIWPIITAVSVIQSLAVAGPTALQNRDYLPGLERLCWWYGNIEVNGPGAMIVTQLLH
jgi:hypothetical protein